MKRLLGWLLSLVTVCFAFAQPSPHLAYIDSVVNYSMNAMPQAGLAIGVVQDGKIIHLKGYGLKNIKDKNSAVDEHTLFSIASNSKAFTTTALGMLVDEGKIQWTDKVVKYIPEFTMYDPYVTAHFTIADLVTHRSGLGLGAGDLMIFPDKTNFTIQDIIQRFQYLKPTSEFRTQFDYDNLLYIIAGEVIHRVSGLTWDVFIEQKIMAPLGMRASVGYYDKLPKNANLAKPHKVEKDLVIPIQEFTVNSSKFAAAGGIYSNVADLSQWMLMHLNEGVYNQQDTLIKEPTHDELWSIHTLMYSSPYGEGYYDSHYYGYGLGFFLSDRKGNNIVQHSGGMPGMLSMVTMVPEKKLGIVVLTNSQPGAYSYAALTNQILDYLLKIQDRNWIDYYIENIRKDRSDADAIVSAVWNQTKKAKSTAIDLNQYIGTYRDAWFGDIKVYKKNDGLWISCENSTTLQGPLSYYGANTFVADWNYDDMECDAFVMFSLDENGKAQGMKLKGISPEMDFSFDFQDLDLHRVE